MTYSNCVFCRPNNSTPYVLVTLIDSKDYYYHTITFETETNAIVSFLLQVLSSVQLYIKVYFQERQQMPLTALDCCRLEH